MTATMARIVPSQVASWRVTEDGRWSKDSLRVEATVMCGATSGSDSAQICRGVIGEIVINWSRSKDEFQAGDRPLHMPKGLFRQADGVWRLSKHARRPGRAALPRRASKLEWNPQDSLERGKFHGPGGSLVYRGNPNWRDQFWASLPATIECPRCHVEQIAPGALLDDVANAMRK